MIDSIILSDDLEDANRISQTIFDLEYKWILKELTSIPFFLNYFKFFKNKN